MKKVLLITVLVTYIFGLVYTASILDYLTVDDAEPRDKEANAKNCLCTGPSCICCVDFNMSLIDLGGPGCVRLKYLGAEEGIAMNVSYGDSLLHSNTVKGPDPEPTCLNIFSKLAQMCAKFTELLPTDDGLRGCLRLEPMLLEEVQLELPIGCFRMGPDGMKIIESSQDIIDQQTPSQDVKEEISEEEAVKQNEVDAPKVNATEIDETDPASLLQGISAADIIAAVSETADEGISMISKWLGIKLTPDSNATKAAPSESLDEKTTIAEEN